ncbi:MAG: tRNA (adenosine(37)-N6)-dimethylallyltransferase MiaA [Pseudomonadales bacterium]
MAPVSSILVLTGPTASGKTDVALALAERLPVTLISMDSAMVYRGMDIGTAKPSAAVLARHPHALVDIRDPAEPYSAADFVRDADHAVRAAERAGRLPVLVGGTMLYLRAFREGLADLPSADPALRKAIAAEGEQRGWQALYEELERIDPVAAAGTHPNNQVRIQRALEVYRATGTPLSDWWRRRAGRGAGERLGARLVEVAVVPGRRGDLAGPIDARFRAMLGAGLVEEVAGLRARGNLSLELPSMRSVGYRQVWAHLDGEFDLDELAERGAAATRSLAKRQLTWLNGWPHVVRLDPAAAAVQTERIRRLLRF